MPNPVKTAKLLREIPRLRVKPGARLDPATVKTGYADMAIESFRLFDCLQQESVIPSGVKFQPRRLFQV